MNDIDKAEALYTLLFKQVSELYTNTDKSQLSAHWQTGKYLEELKQDFSKQTVYGKNYIQRLSRDLTMKYGKGFSQTALKEMRSLYREYPKSPPVDFLGWSKMVMLLHVRDKNTRKELIQKALKENWTRITLQSHIDLYRLKNSNNGKNSNEEYRVDRGSMYLYKIAESEIGKNDDTVIIDCGFNVWRNVALKNARSLKGEILFRTEKREGKYFIKEVLEDTEEERGKFFTYRAKVERVIDGDTFWVQVDTGFGTTVRQKIRLRGVDTPEMGFAEGKRAKRFVQRELKDCRYVIIKTYRTDKYDRYIADLFYIKDEDNLDIICREGILLNSELIIRGYGRRI